MRPSSSRIGDRHGGGVLTERSQLLRDDAAGGVVARRVAGRGSCSGRGTGPGRAALSRGGRRQLRDGRSAASVLPERRPAGAGAHRLRRARPRTPGPRRQKPIT